MDKSIYRLQNQREILECLAAQRKKYSSAKLYGSLKNSLLVTFAVLAIVASWLDSELLTAISTIATVVLLIANKWLDSKINSLKKKGAALQQYIDATLYSDVLNTDTSKWGKLPSQYERAEWIGEADTENLNPFENWYSDYSNLPAKVQVFNSQRENITWDMNLKKSYQRFQVVLIVIVCIIMLSSFLVKNWTFVKLLVIISWILPLMEFALSDCLTLHKDIVRLEKIDESCNMVERKITSTNDDCTAQLIDLQYKIRENREDAYLVPDFYYHLKQSKQQSSASVIANLINRMDGR